jgi:hypothetical protein
VLVLCLRASVAYAQPPLTIAQAVDEAVQHNLALLAQRANLTIADTALLTARLRPSATAMRASRLPPRSSGTSTRHAISGGPPLFSGGEPGAKHVEMIGAERDDTGRLS